MAGIVLFHQPFTSPPPGCPMPSPLFSPIPLSRFNTTPVSQPVSPPLSPAPTVIVSLRAIEPGKSSSVVSLHEYRKNLSRPQLEESVNPYPRRTLKRKPGALNLNIVRSPRIPPSPPQTPLARSPISTFSSSVVSLQSFKIPSPVQREENFLEDPFCHSLTKGVLLPGTTQSFTVPENTSSQQPQPPSPHTPTPADSRVTTDGSTRIKRLNAFRNCLKQIPAKLVSHSKSSSDTALFLGPSQSKTRLRHRGVSFEILNPPKSPCLSVSSHEELDPDPLDTLETELAALLLETMTSPGEPPSADRTPQRDQTPVEYISRSRASSEERRPTPPRALFEDLPTAHSSITSRIAHQRSRLFPLFPYMDQPDDPDLILQLSAGVDVLDSNLQTPSGRPNLLPSHSDDKIFGLDSDSPSIPGHSSPTGGREDVTAGPENTLPNPFLENTSIDQWSKYFSRRNSNQPDHGSTRRTPSKLVKPRPPDRNPRAPGKKRSLSTSSITANFLHRCRANLYSTPSRIEKRNRISREMKKRYSSSSTKRDAGYRLSVSSPLERMSADVEALTAEQSAPAASFAEPNTSGDIPIIAEPRPRSSVYSTLYLPTETYGQSTDTAIQTATGPYFVDPRLSTEFKCDDNNNQQRFQPNSTSSPNFSRPVPSQFPQKIESDAPEPSAYPNPRPSQTHPRIMSIQKPSFRAFPNTPPGHIPGSVRANTSDAGGLQSDPFFGGSDPISLDSEMEDPGPGSSQTTSSQQLSRFGTFSTLRSRFRMPSTLSSRSKDGRGKSQSFAMSPLTKDHKFPSSMSSAYKNNENNAERQGNTGYGQDDVHDWETVVESQQFRSEMGREMGRDMTRMDTGSSLADYSSYGSLATAEAQPWTSLRAPSRRHRFPGPSSNPVPVHPAHQGLAHTHKLHHNPDTGSSILLPNYQYPGESFPRLDSSIIPAPALAVSTDVRPTSLVPSASRYQHPTPLDKPHPHPFQHPPPVLSDRKGKGRLQKPSLYQPPRAGPVSTTRSSKSTSLDASHHQHLPMMPGALLPREQHKKTTMTESVGPPPSSDWYTVSSAQEMAVFSGDSYSQSQSQSHPHPFFSFNNNTTSTNPQSQTGNRHEKSKRPFSYKYPRMSTFAAENLAAATPAANENNSHHSLSLNPHAGAPPRDCSPKSHIQEGVVLAMPERAYAPSTFSSTDRLIPDPATIPSPPRFIHRAQSNESAAKSQQQHTHIASPSAPRWPLASNDQDSAKKRKKVPSRDDLVRERLRQLDNLIPADCNASTSNIIRRTTKVPLQRLPPSIRGTRPPCPYVLATSRSAAGIDEESSVGEWYSSTDGRYAFSSPPRLISTRETYERIREHNTSNFIQQRRVGRELVIGSMIMVPLGWFVLGYIALWGSRSRPLIKWRSKGEVEEFHYKEIRFARKMFASLIVFLAVTALVTATSILATR